MGRSKDFESEEYIKESIERFYKSIKINDSGCWVWIGCTNEKYGLLRFKNKNIGAHRFSFEYIKKQKIGSLNVCHTCDYPLCVNPEHLFLGTHKDNMKDAKAKKRHAYGEKHYQQKLKLKDVEEIRKLVKSGLSQSQIAELFGIEQTGISAIMRGINWKYSSPDEYDIEILLKCLHIMIGKLNTYKLLKLYEHVKKSLL